MMFKLWHVFGVILMLGSGSIARAQSPSQWEVAVLFLTAHENAEYQSDIDHNILELARSSPNKNYHLSIYREFKDRSYEFFVDPLSNTLTPWGFLFGSKPTVFVPVAGEVILHQRSESDKSLIEEASALKSFFASAFKIPGSKRLLILYSHGAAFEGLGNNIGLNTVRDNLSAALPKRAGFPLDILWLDACFMGNLETVYQLRNAAPYIVASEEAEFSSAEPFDMLRMLGRGPSDIESVAKNLAERFVESYSYTKLGSQRKNIVSSSATISVIDTKKLEHLVTGMAALKEAIGSLSSIQKESLIEGLPHLTMERNDVFDLRQLLVFFATQPTFHSPGVQKAVGSLKTILELDKPHRFQTNPRLLLTAPAGKSDSPLLFGYNAWTRGDKSDKDTLSILPTELRDNLLFLSGPGDKKWPSRFVAEGTSLYFSPFSVGLNQFDYYFVNKKNKKPESKIMGFKRMRDFVFLRAKSALNPILLSGYTQGIGSHGERYLGLSVLDPTHGVTTMDYTDLDFNDRTGWGNLNAQP